MATNQLGQLIRQARDAKHWTQDDLAERLDVHRGYVGQLEAGTIKRPGPERLARLEQVLGLSREEMLRAAGLLGPAQDIDVLGELRRINAIEDPDVRAEALQDLPVELQDAIRNAALDFVRQAIPPRRGPSTR